jgi:hypothetical protein
MFVARRRQPIGTDATERKWPFGRALVVVVAVCLWALLVYGCVLLR